MAHPMIFSLPSLILLHQASTSQSYYKPKAQAFLHPIYKDKTTNLYSLPLTIGSNLHSQNFLIDLNGAAPLLLNCTAASTSYHSIRFANPDSSCPKNTTNKPLCHLYVDFDVHYDATALKPIPKAFGGSIGLANNHLSVPSQLVSMYKLPPKMSLCLPSTEGMKSYHNGDFRISGASFFYLPYLKDASKIFSSTP
ncbi:hypothetical protein HID58_075200 [Brassica napus]|uniref:Xylanase inhibitor N-terminal domain-containing protein n=1 Tax=Brassica napus TaxID=3708 RepID=A0ABQ7YJ88_BRANA|nr:hypothetical protein HID58_075200 [Brassica napus]